MNKKNYFFRKFFFFKDDHKIYAKFIDQYSNKEKIYTFHQIYSETIKKQNYLKKAKINKVFISIENNLKFLVYSLAAIIEGIPLILIPKESEHVEEILNNTTGIILIVSKRNYLREKTRNISDIFKKDIYFLSSGSTGGSKVIGLSLSNLIANSESIIKKQDLKTKDKFFFFMPLYHVNSFCMSFFCSIIVKYQIIFTNEFIPFKFWKILSSNKITVCSLNPYSVHILNYQKRRFFIKNECKKIICASAPLHYEEFMKFKNNFGIYILQGYGLSEATNFSFMTSKSDINTNFLDTIKILKHLPVGRKLSCNNFKIINKDQNDIGEVLIKGNNVFDGYSNSKNIDIFDKQNYFKTGDLGKILKINSNWYLFLFSRSKEIINYRGETIFPKDIEFFLNKKIKSLNSITFFVCSINNYYSDNEIALVTQKKLPRKIINLLTKMNNLKLKYAPKIILYDKLNSLYTSTKKPMRSKVKKLGKLKKLYKFNFNTINKLIEINIENK